MKRYLFIFFLGTVIIPLYSQTVNNGHFTFQMLRTSSRFFGYYLPLEFVEDFEKSRDWYLSRKYIDESEYIYIRIDAKGIWVQEPITDDGYSEECIDYRNGIENYQYEIGNNNEIIIFNNVLKKFKKISNTFEYDYDATINNYLGRIVLQDFILSGEITLDKDIIIIPAFDFGKFKIDTWGSFRKYNTNLLIYGFNKGWWLDLIVEGDIITIYTYARWIFADRSGKRIYWRNKP